MSNFQFGPRIWCTIEVIDPSLRSLQSSIATTEQVEPNNNNNLNQSCFTKMNSHSSDLAKSFTQCPSSLNVSMIETYLNSNESKSRIDGDDDLDDEEFVVVPACFDLTKKWNKSNEIDSELRELKKSIMESQCSNNKDNNNNSFVNIDSKKEIDFLNDSVFEFKSSDIDKKLNPEWRLIAWCIVILL